MDVEKAIEHLKDRSRKSLVATAIDVWCVKLAIDALEEQLKDKWIPVNERLPKEDEEVLITLAHGKVVWAFLYLGEWNTAMSTYPKDCILAWKPLPEPYKGE